MLRVTEPPAPIDQATRHAAHPLGATAGSAMQNLRRIRTGWDVVEESRPFGHPAPRVRGTPFTVLARFRDSDCLRLTVPCEPRLVALPVRLGAIAWRRISRRARISFALATAPCWRAVAGR